MKTRFLFLLFILLNFLTPAFAAGNNLTIGENQDSSVENFYRNKPIKIQIYFYDSNGKVINDSFSATNYDNQDNPVPVKSGDIVPITIDHPLVVKELPTGTSYRATLYENFYIYKYKNNVVSLSGKVEGETTSNFNIEAMEAQPYLYPVFNVETNSPELDTKKFSFDVTLADSSMNGKVIFNEAVETTGPGFVCVPVQLTTPGTFELHVRQSGRLDGVKLDETVHKIFVTGERNRDEERTVTEIDYDEMGTKTPPTFTNTVVESVKFSPRVQKVLNGTDSSKEEFTFRLSGEEDNPNVTLPEKREIKVRAGGAGDFSPITFKSEGTYEFTLSEVETGLFGFTYDTNEWKLTVPITSTGTALTLGEVKYTSQALSNSDQATFTNTYNSGNLKISKEVTGKRNDQTDFKFTLSLTDDKGTPLSGNYPTDKEEFETVTNGSIITLKDNEAITIEKLPAGTKYTVTENLEAKGYTESHTGETGEIRKGETPEAHFTNAYQATEITYKPKVKKVLTGEEAPSPENFTFNLSKVNGDDSSVLSGSDLTISGQGEQEFPAITFKQPGTYNYTITETQGSSTGYTYDNGSWNLEVVVEDQDAALQVVKTTYTKESESSNDYATFTNNYAPNPVEVIPKVTKTINGNAPESLKQFKFNIAQSEDSQGDNFSKNSVTVQGSSTEATFTSIKFTKAGTYTYQITEEKQDGPFTYDESQWELKVVVTDNAGNLEAAVSYTKGEETNNTSANFTNDYLSGSLSLTKQVTGKENPEDSFNFTVHLNYKGSSLQGEFPTDKPELNISDGSNFNLNSNETLKISGLPVGTEYSFSENAIPNGYTPRYVEGDKGTISQENKDVTVTCINDYVPSPTTVNAKVSKQISGDKPKSDSTFNFTLKRHDGSQTEGDSLTDPIHAQVKGENETDFETITFNKAGTYQYDISEDSADYTGYSFDTETIIFTVTVVDNDGALTIQDKQYLKGEQPDPEKAVFTNTYQPTVTSYIPKVEKTIDGETPFDSEFTFTLTAKNELAQQNLPEPQTCTITGKGRGNFTELTFSHAGSYEYTITEINSELPGYEYDGNTWLLEIIVDDENGELQVTSHNYSVTSNSEALSINVSSEKTQQNTGAFEQLEKEPETKETVSSKNEPILTQALSDIFSLTVAKAAPLEKVKELSTNANFYNGYRSGTLKITKKVVGESDQSFKFHLNLNSPDGTPLTGSYPTSEGEEVENGSEITLSNNQSIEILDLPVGTAYKVKEDLVEGFKAEVNEFSGTVESGKATEIIFTNEREENPEEPTGNIKVSKKVEGIKTDEKFKFTLSLKSPDGKELSGNYRASNGELLTSGSSFELADGEELTISGIPAGSLYEVKEEENKKYEVVSKNVSGSVDVNNTASIEFLNRYGTQQDVYNAFIPKTGDNLWLLRNAIIIALFALIGVAIFRRKKR